MRAAAIQMEPVLADVDANLQAAERLIDQAALEGAEWIVLPEFFTTGMAFVPGLADAGLPPDGAATELLCGLARRHGARVGGSFLCRDVDGEVRNAFLLAGPDGEVLGRHDKDLPTMWENAFYVGGGDDGVLDAGGLTAGVALCWELMRSQTARRLRGRVDIVVGGSAWWSIPPWPPAAVTRRWEATNARTATNVAEWFAPLVGAPVIHAAHAAPVACRFPGTPITYRGYLEGGAAIFDAHGRVLARRTREAGPGIAVAEITAGRVSPTAPVPDRYWLHRRGPLPAVVWHVQRAQGRRWYARNTRQR